MGCSQSKVETEESVTRCRARKQFMKEAVTARNAFAAAHSSYSMNLKNTGAALSDFAHAEIPSHLTSSSAGDPAGAVSSSSVAGGGQSSGSAASGIVPSSSLPPDSLPPPPPPLPSFASSPLQRAASMPEMKIKKPEVRPPGPVIMEVDEAAEMETPDHEKLVRRRTSRRGSGSGRGVRRDEEAAAVRRPPPHAMPQQQHDSTWDYFFPPVESVPGTTLAEPAEEFGMSKEAAPAVRINEVVDEEDDDDGHLADDDGHLAEDEEDEGHLAEDDKEEEEEDVVIVPQEDVVIVPQKKKLEKAVEVPVQVPVIPVQEKKGLVNRPMKGLNLNLVRLFDDLDDNFLKASQSAHEVSKMLEATRLHYHSNFADNRGHIDHSARVMRVITWNRSFKGIPNVDDGKDDFDSEKNETHATVLDKMLAWEKKLYDEVKVGEQMKYDYQKKVSSLNRQKKRGATPESMEKLKAAVSQLHTRYIVDMQSMDSTVAEVNRLRDEQLYPKLVQLVNGMAMMWDTMRVHHEAQSAIANQLRYLDISQSPVETTDHHHERTYQLAIVVDDWQSEFCKLIDYQRSYIKALNNWLKLNLIPIESSLKEKVSSPPRIQKPPILDLLAAWDGFMDTLQDDGARSAIKNFAAVIHSIYQFQEDEMKKKEKVEDTRRELNRKIRHFEDWYNKYMQRRIPDELDPDKTEENPHKDAVAERQVAVEALKKRLEEEEEDHKKMCLQVREKSLSSLKTRLPELFMAIADISKTFSDMYRKLSSRTQMPRKA